MRRITRSDGGATHTAAAAGLLWLRPGWLREVLAVAALLASAALLPLAEAGAEAPSPASTPRHDYEDALRKSLLYFEAQRSGRLPHGQRVAWRDHSGLTDGLEQGVDLVGGYYDAGDHVKFGLPMAFTVTMLSWTLLEYGADVADAGELAHALESIKWGTDYFIIKLANRAARHGTGTDTARHGPARHGTMRHGKHVVPCLIVPPC